MFFIYTMIVHLLDPPPQSLKNSKSVFQEIVFLQGTSCSTKYESPSYQKTFYQYSNTKLEKLFLNHLISSVNLPPEVNLSTISLAPSSWLKRTASTSPNGGHYTLKKNISNRNRTRADYYFLFYLFIYLTCGHYIYNNIIYSTIWLTRGAQGKALIDAP